MNCINPDILTVHITPEDTAAAEHGDIHDCPLLKALARQYPGAEWAVSDVRAMATIDGQLGPVYDLPDMARATLAQYDVDVARRMAGCNIPATVELTYATYVLTRARREDYAPIRWRERC